MTLDFDGALGLVNERGLLLVQDKRIDCLVTRVVGAPLNRSWWGHPQASRIFSMLDRLHDHHDLVFCKLLLGKVTMVHRQLWPALVAVATSGDTWQQEGLDNDAIGLLAKASASNRPLPCSNGAARKLERRLLVHTDQVHTDTGSHQLMMESWSSWARRAGVVPEALEFSYNQLNAAARDLGAPPNALPWNSLSGAD